MSIPTRAARREAAHQCHSKKKRQHRQLRAQRATAGLSARAHPDPANHRAPPATIEAEREARTELVSEQMRVLRAQLPALLQ